MMKSLLILCAFAVFQQALGVELKDIKEVREKCAAETGFKENPESIKLNEANKDAKCYLKCLMETKGVLKKDGTTDLDMAKAYISDSKAPAEMKEKMLKVVEECVKEVKPNPDDLCETAYQYFVCKHSKMDGKN